jgi:uncharacterized membrane protein
VTRRPVEHTGTPDNEPDPPPGRSRGLDRLLTFSDGVVAIAATLLVLPLVDIAPDTDTDTTELAALLGSNSSKFLAFTLSFVVIYRFWLLHHRVFDNVTGYTSAVVWANGLWLLSIVFLPFPTQLIGSQDSDERLAYGLYIGTLLVTSASGVLLRWLIARAGLSPSAGTSLTPAVVITGAMALALILAVAVPGVGAWALLLLIPAGIAQGRILRVARSRIGDG